MIKLKPGTKFGDLELETKYKFETDGRISSGGIRQVRAMLNAHTEISKQHTRWRFEVDRSIGGPIWKTLKGTFPRRVSRYMYKTYNIKLNVPLVRAIGNVAQQNSTQGNVVFDFTRRISWEAGDFRDAGSCFWTDYGGSRIAMMRAEIGAIRIYSPRGAHGRGRAWFYPLPEGFVLFNAYGIMQARTIANFLSQLFGEDYDYRRTSIGHTYTQNSLFSGTYELYLNSDGYVVYNKPFTKKLAFPVLNGRSSPQPLGQWITDRKIPGEGDKWFDKE